MTTFISLLRGVNVGGHRKIRMAELRDLYVSLGYRRVRSYLQSGNVLFDADTDDAPAAARRIEAGIADVFGFDVTVMIRDAGEMRRVLEGNPFLDRGIEARFLHVAFLAALPVVDDPDALAAAVPRGAGEDYRIAGREIYLFYPNGTGKAKLTGAFFEKRLGVAQTTRNWNSVAALTDLVYE